MATTFQIKGERELDDMLRALPSKVHGQVIVAGLKKASLPMKKRAKQLAPKRKGGTGGTLRKSITTVTRSKNPAEVWTAPTKGKGVKYDAWYGRFQEFGTTGFGKRRRISGTINGKRTTITTGYKKRGTGLPAIHFMKNAFDQNIETSKKLINTEVQKQVIRFIQRKAPRYAG